MIFFLSLMFTKDSKPFKLSFFNPKIENEDVKDCLIEAYSCTKYANVISVGFIISGRLTLLNKADDGKFYSITSNDNNKDGESTYSYKEFPCIETQMKMDNFIENFKDSDAIDFIVISIPCLFLITKLKDQKLAVYMTNHHNYFEIFADPSSFFPKDNYKVNYCTEDFNLKYLQTKSSINKDNEIIEKEDDIELGKFAVDIDSLNKEEFLKFKKKNKITNSIKLGWVENKEIKFIEFPLSNKTNEFLKQIILSFTKSHYKFIEILGKTRIAGKLKEGTSIWFTSLNENETNVADYIETINNIFEKII